MSLSPWAVLLCKFKDNITEPLTRDYYEDLFTTTGVGSQNMVDYFRDVSHGNLDLSGSRVFGWYTLNKESSEYTGSGVNQTGRNDLINWARQAAIADGVDLSQYVGVVVCMNVPTDLFGGGAGVVCDYRNTQPHLLGQEMGHLYGLDHSRADGSTMDYRDRWDVMSVTRAYSTTHPRFTWIGPGPNAANMAGRGWLDESRVWTASNRSFDTVVQLRPLFRRDLPGFLAARVGEYLIEFRNKDGWDAGIPRPAVLMHRFEDNRSYLMSANNGDQDLVTGSVFGTVDPTTIFTPVTRIEVVEINPAEQFAKVRLLHRPAFEAPSLGPGILIGGVAEGGGGLVIVGGTIVRVPPRSPLFQILEQVATYATSESIASVQMRNAVRQETLSAIVNLAENQIQTMQVFRQPAPSLQTEEPKQE